MKWPHEDVSEMRKQQDDGLYKVKIIGGEDSPSDGERPAAIIIRGRGLAPAGVKNMPFDLYFRIGVTEKQAEGLRISTGEDLDADNEETWTGNPSAQSYKSLLKACKVADTGDTEEEYEDLKGSIYHVMLKTNAKGYQNYAAFYGEDDELPEKVDEKTARPGKADPKQGLKKRRDREEEPDEHEEPEDEPEPEDQPAKAKKGSKGAPKKQAAEDDDWD